MERFSWLTDILDVKPGDNILEIGCGVGFAVESIAPLLGKGVITAIDQSESAISKAVTRNETAIKSKKAVFIQTSLLEIPAQKKKFDKIFSFNINFFWTKKSIHEEAIVIKKLLASGGQLYILYGPMFDGAFEKIKPAVQKNLLAEGFDVKEVLHNRQLKCCCFITFPR